MNTYIVCTLEYGILRIQIYERRNFVDAIPLQNSVNETIIKTRQDFELRLAQLHYRYLEQVSELHTEYSERIENMKKGKL